MDAIIKSLDVEKWIDIAIENNNYYLLNSLEDILLLRDYLPKHLYKTLPRKNWHIHKDDPDPSGITIVGYLLWLIRDATSFKYYTIVIEANYALDKILAYGFDVNKTETSYNGCENGKKVRLLTPVAELMRMDAIDETLRYKLLKKMKKAGADFHLFNIWDGKKIVYNYKKIYSDHGLSYDDLNPKAMQLFN